MPSGEVLEFEVEVPFIRIQRTLLITLPKPTQLSDAAMPIMFVEVKPSSW